MYGGMLLSQMNKTNIKHQNSRDNELNISLYFWVYRKVCPVPVLGACEPSGRTGCNLGGSKI